MKELGTELKSEPFVTYPIYNDKKESSFQFCMQTMTFYIKEK